MRVMTDSSRSSLVFVAVGSNVEPQHNIIAALNALRETVHVGASSTFYRTEALGRQAQPDFVNGVWRIEATLEPARVEDEVLKPIEIRLGRRRTDDKFAPRRIDLDLVLYDALVVDEIELVLPHPDIKRPFVYVPIVELLDEVSDEIEPGRWAAIRALLPAGQPAEPPGEPLYDFTRELRRLLGGP
jgi:2-amino-4-hydroxy-6-hydroxymethyldihydropteridine diphosphokinase